MKRIGSMLFMLLLTACATQGGGGDGTPPRDMTRAQAIARAHTELAASYYDRTQYAVALQETAVAMRADADYAPAYNVRAMVRMALREDEKADADFRRSLELDGSSSETHNNYGWFLCQRGHPQESLKQFQSALDNPLYATPEAAYVNLAVCSRKAGVLRDVESNLQRALLLRPGMPEALYALSDWHYASGDYAEARSYFLRFTQAVNELSAEQLLLGVRVMRRAGDVNSAASFALQLRKNYPDSPEANLLSQGE